MACKHPPRRPYGLTLIEALIWLSFLAILAVFFSDWRGSLYFDRVVSKTTDGFVQFDEAAYAYYADNSVWPADITALGAYIPNLQNVNLTDLTAGINGVGLPYSLESDPDLVIKTTLATREQAVAVVHQFPNTATCDACETGTYEVALGVVEPALTFRTGVVLGVIIDDTVNYGLTTAAACSAAGGILLNDADLALTLCIAQ